MKTITLTLCLLTVTMLSTIALAAPIITKVSNSSGSITIEGSGFGAKATASPYKWDDFESGNAGSALNGWLLDSSGGPKPQYSSLKSHSGLKSGLAQFIGVNNYNCTAYVSLGSLSEIYFSYWVYVDKLSGDYSRNIKYARAVGSSSYKDNNWTMPGFGITNLSSSITNTGDPTAYYWSPNDTTTKSTYLNYAAGDLAFGQWHRIEMYSKVNSQLDVNDGVLQVWDNGKLLVNQTSIVNTTISQLYPNERTYRWFVLPFYVAHDPGGDHNIYYDDVYIDNTRARVEMCQNSTWSTRGKCETQIPTAWNPNGSSITANINQGQFSVNTVAYLYVVNSDGTVNTNGYPVTINVGSGPIQAPKGLQGTIVK